MQFKNFNILTVKEICTKIQRGIFCEHKPGFLMLGHVCESALLAFCFCSTLSISIVYFCILCFPVIDSQ